MRGVVAVAALAVRLALSPAFGQERFRRTPPLPDARPVELKLPEVRTAVLENGLTVATAVQPGALTATLMLVVKAGEADSPPDRPGLAGLTARMIGKGTKRLSAEYFENMVEAMGTELSAETRMDYTTVSLRVLPEQLDRAIFALRLMVLEASFSERELAAVRREAFWGLVDRMKDPEALARRHLFRVLFEGHPYRTAAYAEDVIKFIAAKDVAAFYEAFYRPANAAVIVFGAIDGETAARRVAGHFGGWQGAFPGRVAVPPPSPNARDRVCFVEAPNAPSAAVVAGNVVMDASGPDVFPFLVLMQVLGGTTRSRLFMSLRETKGYAFYAFSEAAFFRSCGAYWARALAPPETIVAAAREILREIEALAAAPAGPAEIEEGKSFLIGNLPARFESPEGFAEGLARRVALGLDEAQWDKGPERVKLVNADTAGAAARRHLAARPIVVIAGRPEWLGPVAEAFASVEVYDPAGTLVRTLVKGERQ